MEIDDDELPKKSDSAQKRESAGKQLERIASLDHVVTDLKPMLISLGHHLSTSPVLFTRICRLLKLRLESLRAAHSCTEVGGGAANMDEAALLATPEVKDMLFIISETLLPALTKLECNPAQSALLWGLMSLLPFQTRFDMYRVWKGEGFGKQVSLFLLCHRYLFCSVLQYTVYSTAVLLCCVMLFSNIVLYAVVCSVTLLYSDINRVLTMIEN